MQLLLPAEGPLARQRRCPHTCKLLLKHRLLLHLLQLQLLRLHLLRLHLLRLLHLQLLRLVQLLRLQLPRLLLLGRQQCCCCWVLLLACRSQAAGLPQPGCWPRCSRCCPRGSACCCLLTYQGWHCRSQQLLQTARPMRPAV
jgi:hypothetical protein